MTELPEWAGRAVLAEALKSCGLPVVYGAMWRRPRDGMDEAQRQEAIVVYGQVLAAARRGLPAGTSGSALGQEWRDAAWRCTVAGFALLDAQARERLAGRRDDEAEPVESRRRMPEAAVAPVNPPHEFTIRRRGEVARVS